MTGSYSMQSRLARTTRGPHVKSRTLEIKSHVHTIIFYAVTCDLCRAWPVTYAVALADAGGQPAPAPLAT